MLARNLPTQKPKDSIILAQSIAILIMVILGILVIWGSQSRINEYNDYMMSMYSQEAK